VVTYSQDDLNFDWDAFSEKINNELIANIGNFVNRALSFTQKAFAGRVPEPASIDDTLAKELSAVVDEVGSLLSSNEIDKALRRILKYSTYMNQYFQSSAPWANKETANTTLYMSVNAVRSMAIMLEPFIPFSAEKIWSQLGMIGNVHEQPWISAATMGVHAGHRLGKVEPIFRKIEAKEIEQWKNKLGKPQ
jgi:methionyl-tRNA synthetase